MHNINNLTCIRTSYRCIISEEDDNYSLLTIFLREFFEFMMINVDTLAIEILCKSSVSRAVRGQMLILHLLRYLRGEVLLYYPLLVLYLADLKQDVGLELILNLVPQLL